jgi:hypothetical protein
MANDKMKPAPEAKRCEAGGNSCGAGQPLYVTNSLTHCEPHASWPESKEGQLVIAIRDATKKVGV